MSLSELSANVNAVYAGNTPLSSANVREALHEISGYRVWRKLLNDVAKGRAHYEASFLIELLLGLLSEQTSENSKAPSLPDNTVDLSIPSPGDQSPSLKAQGR